MCCHLAEVGAPRPVQVARFAMGVPEANPISLAVDEDWTYKQALTTIGPQQYAAHGGLIIYADRTTGEPRGFHSTLTIGPLRYVFYVRLLWFAQLELRIAHRDFSDWCRGRALDQLSEPMSIADQLRLGLIAEEQSEPT